MISVCLSTRGRAKDFKEMCQSMLATASKPEAVEFVSYHDDDDTTIYEYMGNHKEVFGKRVGPPGTNECYKIATGPIYMFTADDIRFESHGWDKAIEDAFEQIKDKIALVHFNDHNPKNRNFGYIGCLHKNWIDSVGYFIKPDIIRRSDRWINELARGINRSIYLEDVFFRHLDIRDDDTHQVYIKRCIETKHDEYYNSQRPRLLKDINKLYENITKL